ncbi:adhesin, partial [Micromonospora arborensis]
MNENGSGGAAARVWAALSDLVLRQENRRAEVEQALGLSFLRAQALRRLLPGPLPMRELTERLRARQSG